MEMITVTAKTLDEAITKALIQLGTTSDNLEYTVIEKGSAGFLGFIGKKDVVIQAKKKKENDLDATVINPYYITGLDTKLLESLKKDHDIVITIEDGMLDGGFGEKIARFYGDSNLKVLNFGVRKEFPDRYDLNELLKENHLTKEQIVADIQALL